MSDTKLMMPAHVLPAVRPTLSVRGRLWVPAEAPMVLRLKTKTLNHVEIELREATGEKTDLRATWHWKTEDGRIESKGVVYCTWVANELSAGTTYADADLTSAYRRKEISREEMFERTRERHSRIIVEALTKAAEKENPFAGLSWCCFCGRCLVDADSVARGIGPECLGKWLGLNNNLTSTAVIVSERSAKA